MAAWPSPQPSPSLPPSEPLPSSLFPQCRRAAPRPSSRAKHKQQSGEGEAEKSLRQRRGEGPGAGGEGGGACPESRSSGHPAHSCHYAALTEWTRQAQRPVIAEQCRVRPSGRAAKGPLPPPFQPPSWSTGARPWLTDEPEGALIPADHVEQRHLPARDGPLLDCTGEGSTSIRFQLLFSWFFYHS